MTRLHLRHRIALWSVGAICWAWVWLCDLWTPANSLHLCVYGDSTFAEIVPRDEVKRRRKLRARRPRSRKRARPIMQEEDDE